MHVVERVCNAVLLYHQLVHLGEQNRACDCNCKLIMCLGMQNDQDGACQQSVDEGGNVVQVQSQKGTVSLSR